MTREREIADLLLADVPLMAMLLGGVYTSEEIGVEGYRRGEDSPTDAAFDEEGYLLPNVTVRERAINPYGGIRSLKDKITSVSQVVEIYFYERRGYDQIYLAKDRVYEILQGVRLTKTYPIWWVMETPPFADVGPVANSTTLRQDWQVVSIRRPA